MHLWPIPSFALLNERRKKYEAKNTASYVLSFVHGNNTVGGIRDSNEQKSYRLYTGSMHLKFESISFFFECNCNKK